MAIVIQQPTVLSPQAQQNQFNALMERNRLEAAQKRQDQALMARAVGQGVQNIVNPMQRAVLEKQRADRADQRFNKQQEAISERANNSLAVRMGMTPDEFTKFNNSGQPPPSFVQRQTAQQQAKLAQQMQQQQAKAQMKAQGEREQELLSSVDEFAKGGNASPAFLAENNRIIQDELAILGDPESSRADQSQRAASLEGIKRRRLDLAGKIPKQPSPAEMMSKKIIPASDVPAFKDMIDAGVLPSGAPIVTNRNGEPRIMAGYLDFLKLQQQKGKDAQESRPDALAADDYLDMLGKASTVLSKDGSGEGVDLNDAIRLVSSAQGGGAVLQRMAENDKKVKSTGRLAPVARKFFNLAEKQQSIRPGVTGEQLMQEQVQFIMSEMPKTASNDKEIERILRVLESIEAMGDVAQ